MKRTMYAIYSNYICRPVTEDEKKYGIYNVEETVFKEGNEDRLEELLSNIKIAKERFNIYDKKSDTYIDKNGYLHILIHWLEEVTFDENLNSIIECEGTWITSSKELYPVEI